MSAAGDVWETNVLRAGTKWSVPFFNKLLDQTRMPICSFSPGDNICLA